MKKLTIFKIILFISIIGFIIFSLLFVLYIYDITQKNKTSKNLASSFSVSYLYSQNSSYTATLQDSSAQKENPFVIGILKIDKIKLDYPILSEVSDDLLKIAPCRFAGPLPNNVGNLCIAGHNYLDNTFFAKISSLKLDDEFTIYGLDGKSLNYKIFDKKEVESTDLSCTSQETNGKEIVTLMTCNSIKKTRIIVQACSIS